MVRSLVLGTVLGGLVMFGWGAVNHMLLPWTTEALLPFTNEEAVRQAVVANTPRPGIYVLPNIPPNTPREQQQAAMAAAEHKMMQGPMVFASIRLGPAGSMAGMMTVQVLIDLAGGLLATALLLQARPLSYFGRVLFVVGIAAAIAIVGALPAWNWYNFSGLYTLTELADVLVGWVLAGLVIAKVVR